MNLEFFFPTFQFKILSKCHGPRGGAECGDVGFQKFHEAKEMKIRIKISRNLIGSMESRIPGIYRINISWEKETRKHKLFFH